MSRKAKLISCPFCGTKNSGILGRCWKCGRSLKPEIDLSKPPTPPVKEKMSIWQLSIIIGCAIFGIVFFIVGFMADMGANALIYLFVGGGLALFLIYIHNDEYNKKMEKYHEIVRMYEQKKREEIEAQRKKQLELEQKKREKELLKQKQVDIKFISEQIENIDSMSFNLLNMIDENILLDCDIVITLQGMFAYERYDVAYFKTEIKNAYDRMQLTMIIREAMEKTYKDLGRTYEENNVNDNQDISDEPVLLKIATVQNNIKRMVEILRDDYPDYGQDEIAYACWESIKRVSIQFYSNIWEERYGKFIGDQLLSATNDNQEALKKYIEKIILCNEIDNSSENMLSLFTYYAMDKGYMSNELYYPLCYKLILNLLIRQKKEVKEKQIKESLKNGIKKYQKYYTIDDIDLMSGQEFERFISQLYQKMGYSTETTKGSGDQGIDIIAKRQNIKVGIQTKRYSNVVSNSAVQEVVAGKRYYNCDKVLVITNNFFTKSAIELAKANDVILWDRNILKNKLEELSIEK